MKKVLLSLILFVSIIFTPVFATGYISDEINYCKGFAKADSDFAMTAFNLKGIPYMHYAKVASELGFKDPTEGDEVGTVIWVKNKIKENLGRSTDNNLFICIASYGDLFKKYGEMYGVDPNLLALIAAQEGMCEDLTGSGGQ